MMLTGLVFSAEWILGQESVSGFRSGAVAMVPSTALCFLLASGCLLLWLKKESLGPGPARVALPAAAATLIAIAGSNVLVIRSGSASGIDGLIWPAARVLQTDTMAYGSALEFLLLALCLLCLCHQGRRLSPVCQWSATIGLVSSVTALVGYAFGSATLYEVHAFSAMALNTAACFFLLFLAVLLARPHRGWIGILMSEGTGGKSARRLLTVLVPGQLLMGCLVLKVTEISMISENFRLSILVITMTGFLMVTVLRHARIENASEEEVWSFRRRLDEADVDRDMIVREASHRIKNNLQQITAFVDMERSRLQDPAARSVLQSLSGRLRALGLIHDNLLDHRDVTRVSMDAFLRDLAINATEAYGLGARGIDLSVEAVPVEVSPEVGVSIGLLANELVMNAVKHAFPGKSRGRIRVSFEKTEGEDYILNCSDNGVGLSGKPVPGTGSRIVETIIRQLQGREVRCIAEARRGTCRRILLPGHVVDGRMPRTDGMTDTQAPAA